MQKSTINNQGSEAENSYRSQAQHGYKGLE